jgi:hypothetical protein
VPIRGTLFWREAAMFLLIGDNGIDGEFYNRDLAEISQMLARLKGIDLELCVRDEQGVIHIERRIEDATEHNGE